MSQRALTSRWIHKKLKKLRATCVIFWTSIQFRASHHDKVLYWKIKIWKLASAVSGIIKAVSLPVPPWPCCSRRDRAGLFRNAWWIRLTYCSVIHQWRMTSSLCIFLRTLCVRAWCDPAGPVCTISMEKTTLTEMPALQNAVCCPYTLHTSANECILFYLFIIFYLFFYSGTIYSTLMATWCKPLIFPPPKHLVVLETLHFSQRKVVAANFFFYYLVVDVFLFTIRPKRTNVDVCRKKNTLVKLFVLLSYLFTFAYFHSIQFRELYFSVRNYHCAYTVHTIHVPNNTRYTDSTPYKNTSSIPEIVDERTITEDFKVYVILTKVQCAKYINN